jgi:hypothetical protein
VSEGRIVLGVSRARRAVPDVEWRGFLHGAAVTIDALLGDGRAAVVAEGEDTAIIASGVGLTAHESGCSGLTAVPMASELILREGGSVKVADLAYRDAEAARSSLSRVCPPFGFFVHDAPAEAIVVGTDGLGLRHMYVAQ